MPNSNVHHSVSPDPNEFLKELQQEMKAKVKAMRNETALPCCSICGKPIAFCYPETIPGIIHATCSSGHKIRLRKEALPRKSI